MEKDGNVWTGFIWLRTDWWQAQALEYIKGMTFLHYLRTYQLLKKDSAP
jgi:hypothetical protein